MADQHPASRPGKEGHGFFGHPVGLGYLAFTEAWERFSFSGMQILLVLYMVGQLLHPGHIEQVAGFAHFRALLEGIYGPMGPQPLSSVIFGLYTSLVFLMPVFGGLIGDRWLGQHKMVMIGAVLMAGGHFCMAFEQSFLLALLLLILGSGCLKGNISTQVGALYEDGDRRRTAAFQIFSVGINVGVIVAPFVCGTLGELYGWHYGFGAAGIGMMIGLAIYIAGRKHLPPDRLRTASAAKGPILPKDPKVTIGLVLVFLLVTSFLTGAGQLGNVYNLWLKTEVDRSFFSLTVPVTWFHTLTPIFTAIYTALILPLWERQARVGKEPGALTKMGVGLGLTAAGIGLLAVLAAATTAGHSVSWMWMLLMHSLVAVGYLMVWPVGLALFSQAAPVTARAMFIGIFFITSFIASNIVGWLGKFYETLAPLAFWLMQAAIPLCGALLVLLLGRFLSAALNEQHAEPAHH